LSVKWEARLVSLHVVYLKPELKIGSTKTGLIRQCGLTNSTKFGPKRSN